MRWLTKAAGGPGSFAWGGDLRLFPSLPRIRQQARLGRSAQLHNQLHKGALLPRRGQGSEVSCKVLGNPGHGLNGGCFHLISSRKFS